MSSEKFTQKKYSNLASRRDYSKISVDFQEPDLLEFQRKSYNHFLKYEVKDVIKSYFQQDPENPDKLVISHPKNNKYSVVYNDISFAKPLRTEEEARNEGKSYEQALYVDLSLVNNETGNVSHVKENKKTKCPGIMFANIPMMTSKGTFIVNGIEKFVISQIVRSPGAYILSKSQIKLNTKKKINTGYICEILPSRGTLMNFQIDEHNNTVIVTMRNSLGDSAPSFPATQLLKAFGMTQDEIRRIFRDDDYILNTLFSEPYNHESILDDFEIITFRKLINTNKTSKIKAFGSPIDNKLKSAIEKYEEEKTIVADLRAKYEEKFDQYSNGVSSNKTEVEKLLNSLNFHEKNLRKLLDTIITEKAAKNLIQQLAISTRAVEANASTATNQVCYQDVLANHFMLNRQYDLTSAGRYKLSRKLRVSERLYHRVLAQDIHDLKGKLVLPAGTLINKEELDIIKQHLGSNNLDIVDEISLNNEVSCERRQSKLIETITVYTDNDQNDVYTPIIGYHGDVKSKALTVADFVSVISYTINLPRDIGSYDDIDHLGNKHLRLIHEQLRSKLSIGMARVEKHIKDKLASISIATANDEQQAKIAKRTTVKSVVNTKAFQLVVKNFFNSYQLTQFLDQQNPLSELTNKRRISAMGDGGISREDPNLNIRDVHYSHYGRICPIETPEGMNIGLIMSLSAFTKVDDNGFLISPYHKVVNGVVQKEVEWLTALREDEYIIAEAATKCNAEGKIMGDKVVARYRSSIEMYDPKKVDYIDISPRQVVSIATGSIPFLEHDDTARALMGANMQRQAVPLIHPYAPIIGTGTEYKIAHDSGVAVTADVDGTVIAVDGTSIKIEPKDGGKNQFAKLVKYRKSNQDTCINQTPIVKVGQKVKAGETIADGPAMYNGELALGRNPLVAFMTWNGYNFEDAVIISERLVKDDVYTSICIEEYTIKCLRTKNGDEEITREVPNVSDESKRYLDENGIIMVGAEVKEGDILVGKVSPKGQTDYTAEEKLLQAIFGNKTRNFRDSSLKVPHGGEGIVAKIQRFSISNNDELDDDVIELIKIYVIQKRKIQIGDKMSGRHGNKGIVSIVVPVEDMPYLEDGTPIDILLNPLGVPSRMNIGQIFEIHLGYALRQIAMNKAIQMAAEKAPLAEVICTFGLEEAKAKALMSAISSYLTKTGKKQSEVKNCELLAILKTIGLHYEDLNYKAATPVFAGADINDIKNAYKEIGIDVNKTLGKFQLYDGKTGEPFDAKTTVGVMYMMKLDHMVDDKVHARAVGPYSKITQQPLGGKSQNGGQRFGEMEVWALEAYGAAYNLQELLTIKSDDVKGRNLTYAAIVKGKPFPTPSLPESFKLLTKQLQGLCLHVNVIKEDGSVEDINDYTSVISDRELKDTIQSDDTVTVETIDEGDSSRFENNF